MKAAPCSSAAVAATWAGLHDAEGRIVICGDADDALADSMYEGAVFVGGSIRSLGNDAVIQEPMQRPRSSVHLFPLTTCKEPPTFKKVVSGRKL